MHAARGLPYKTSSNSFVRISHGEFCKIGENFKSPPLLRTWYRYGISQKYLLLLGFVNISEIALATPMHSLDLTATSCKSGYYDTQHYSVSGAISRVAICYGTRVTAFINYYPSPSAVLSHHREGPLPRCERAAKVLKRAFFSCRQFAIQLNSYLKSESNLRCAQSRHCRSRVPSSFVASLRHSALSSL